MDGNDSATFTRMHHEFISPRFDDYRNWFVFAKDIEN